MTIYLICAALMLIAIALAGRVIAYVYADLYQTDAERKALAEQAKRDVDRLVLAADTARANRPRLRALTGARHE